MSSTWTASRPTRSSQIGSCAGAPSNPELPTPLRLLLPRLPLRLPLHSLLKPLLSAKSPRARLLLHLSLHPLLKPLQRAKSQRAVRLHWPLRRALTAEQRVRPHSAQDEPRKRPLPHRLTSRPSDRSTQSPNRQLGNSSTGTCSLHSSLFLSILLPFSHSTLVLSHFPTGAILTKRT